MSNGQYEQDMENWKLQSEYNWKLHEDSVSRINMLNERQAAEDDKEDKWMMTIAAGSFGLSFAFIDKIVAVNQATHIPLLISAWSCFLAILAAGLIGFMVSSIGHTALADEEAKNLALKYQRKDPEYKRRSIYFDPNAVLGYASILLFIGGSLCLILFIAKNLL